MKAAALLSVAFSVGIASGSDAKADLANCIVLWRCDGKVGRACEMIVSESIYDAYAGSENSADNLVFILDMKSDLRAGEYAVDRTKLVFGEAFTLDGYRIRAADTDGLMNGVIEIQKGLNDGRIYELRPGKRNGLLATPQYVQERPFRSIVPSD
jgi:hypothetical protein